MTITSRAHFRARFAIALLGIIFCIGIPRASFAAQVQIAIVDSNYSPQTMHVNAGDTVVWTNTGSMVHTVTSDDGIFSSAPLQPGQNFSYTFAAPGSFRYYCKYHGAQNGVGMSGMVVVNNGAQLTQSTSANTNATTLQQQVQALLNQVNQLRSQYGGASTGAAPARASSCPTIGRVLKRGTSGDDVSRLQQFLAQDPAVYSEGQITGYYGALTEAAVERWQVKYNIVASGSPGTTGYGVVGPRTAAAIALLCSQGANGGNASGQDVGGYIQVTPVSGNAPLNINVQATVNTTKSCQAAAYALDWGDNTPPVTIQNTPSNCAPVTQPLSHTYQVPGTYQIILSAGSHRTTAQVAVYGSVSNGYPYQNPNGNVSNPNTTPGTGSANNIYGPLSITPGVGGNVLAVSVRFAAGSCNSYAIDWGDGTTPSNHQNNCGADNGTGATQSETHTYTNSSTYSITLRRGPALNYTDSASISISN